MAPQKDEDGTISFSLDELADRDLMISSAKQEEAEARTWMESEFPEEEVPKFEYFLCKNCQTSHLERNMVNMICSNCQWECPQCEEITVKPEDDYVCKTCRYGDSTRS